MCFNTIMPSIKMFCHESFNSMSISIHDYKYFFGQKLKMQAFDWSKVTSASDRPIRLMGSEFELRP